MKQTLLGIDIGTSACKAAAFDEEGRVLAQASEPYGVSQPAPGYAQQDPEEWWAAVCRAIGALLSQVDPKSIAGVGIDGQSWSAIPVDAGGEVLCDTPIWMDTRASGICQRLREEIGEERLFSVCGNPLQPTYTLPKILWYREQLPQVYRRAEKILQSNSFLAYRLTGVLSQDLSQGYGLSCFSMKNLCWDKDLCRELGVDPRLLPDLVPSHRIIGSVTSQAARLTGLLPGTPVAAGGLDAACGTLGAGVIDPGQTQEQGGQAGGMSLCMDRCAAHKQLILGAHVVPDRWLLQGGTVGGGGAVKWFEEEFCRAERETAAQKGTSPYFEMDREAQAIAPGSEGLVFLPYMAGERSPIWDPKAKGVFYGMDFSKTRAHFIRAVMEGVAYSLRHNLETAEESGVSAGVLSTVGGAGNSPLWCQIKADVTGKPISLPNSATATALGAALLAGVGVGMYQSFDQAVKETVKIKKTYLPNPERKALYDRGYRTYLELYRSLKPLMQEG